MSKRFQEHIMVQASRIHVLLKDGEKEALFYMRELSTLVRQIYV